MSHIGRCVELGYLSVIIIIIIDLIIIMINDDDVNNTKVVTALKPGIDSRNCPSISVGSVGLVR